MKVNVLQQMEPTQSTHNQFLVCVLRDVDLPLSSHLIEDIEITGAASAWEWNLAIADLFGLSCCRRRLTLADNRLCLF